VRRSSQPRRWPRWPCRCGRANTATRNQTARPRTVRSQPTPGLRGRPGAGNANSGVRGDGGAARAEHAGPATAHGPGSRTTSGIDESTGLTGMGMRGRKKRRREGLPDPVDGPGTGEANAPDLRVSVRDTGDAIATNGGVAVSIVYIDQSVRQEAPQAPVAWPHQVGAVPRTSPHPQRTPATLGRPKPKAA
jgi:hypothetical protein